MMKAVSDYYEIKERSDGLVDVWLTPGELVPIRDDLTGRTDYRIRLMAVRGINPEDPQWDGNLEEHIRRHYAAWLESAEEIEI